ncbi:hypothetical protein [Candidatus Enterovibrio altilux]|uniref:Mobile element protein n=1 Tax=Candidatus Enterovibrio altilux TaxID=1927128 RepID=A0A291BB98_9GAMM|nr:hypothetical protein BTN50_1853 [Candidatus Enterovibrio luxaltus]
MTDGEVLADVLKQTCRKIKEIPGESTYNLVCIKRAFLLIFSKKGATFGERGHLRNVTVSY